MRFPQGQMSDRVIERIMQIAQTLDMNKVQRQGMQLDAALNQPVGDVAPMPGVEDAVVARSLDL